MRSNARLIAAPAKAVAAKITLTDAQVQDQLAELRRLGLEDFDRFGQETLERIMIALWGKPKPVPAAIVIASNARLAAASAAANAAKAALTDAQVRDQLAELRKLDVEQMENRFQGETVERIINALIAERQAAVVEKN